MSKLVTDTISHKNDAGLIEILNGKKFYQPNSVVQMIYNRTDLRPAYTASNSGNGVTITELDTAITPMFATSMLFIDFMLTGEVHQDVVFLMHKNANLITDSGFESYNNVLGNNRWSGIAAQIYDANENSTPNIINLQFFTESASTSTQTFSPAIRSSSGSNRTYRLNRTIGDDNRNSYETSVSTCTIMEVAV